MNKKINFREIIVKSLMLVPLALVLTFMLTVTAKMVIVPLISSHGMSAPPIAIILMLGLPQFISLIPLAYFEVFKGTQPPIWEKVSRIGSGISAVSIFGVILHSSGQLIPAVIYTLFSWHVMKLYQSVESIRHGKDI